ncbi:MAG: HNH endonuclease [Sedimentisphaerales bacterium]|nr:HNH endonuclease [Sedimentisphaerales bacterium]
MKSEYRKTCRRDNRPSAARRGYGRRWQRLRLRFLKANPLCEDCASQGITTAATEVDHKIPHNGDPKLLYDWDNLSSKCKSCHSRKTAKYDGGFGRGNGSR